MTEADDKRELSLSLMMTKKLIKVVEQFDGRLDPRIICFSLMQGIVSQLTVVGLSPEDAIRAIKELTLEAVRLEVEMRNEEQQKEASVH